MTKNHDQGNLQKTAFNLGFTLLECSRRTLTIMLGSMEAGLALEAESWELRYFYPQREDRERANWEWHRLWKPQSLLLSVTSSNKVTSKPSQTVPPMEMRYSIIWTCGGHSRTLKHHSHIVHPGFVEYLLHCAQPETKFSKSHLLSVRTRSPD